MDASIQVIRISLVNIVYANITIMYASVQVIRLSLVNIIYTNIYYVCQCPGYKINSSKHNLY